MRLVSETHLQALVSALPPGFRVVCSGNFATPRHALALIDAAAESYRLSVLNAQTGIPDRPGVVHESSFLGPGMRRSTTLSYVPCRLSLLPQLIRTSLIPDLVLLHTSTPYEGTISLGTEVNVLPAAIEAIRARGGLVVAQMNPRMPYTYGDAVIPADMVDVALEVDEPLPSPPGLPADESSKAIGALVADRVTDGSTLQLGIGAIPDAVLPGLSGRRELKIWSEMISDGVLHLDRVGALDRTVPVTASFLFGSEDLYRWVHRNPRVQLLRTETTNDPSRIRAHDLMVSINSALQVDLYAQVNASRIRGRIYSGFGGQTDFIVGALHSRGGQALIALRSWHPRAECSTIVPMLEEPVTSFQPTAVVTENGVAEVFGRPERDQVADLIDRAAHPRVRDELWEEAGALGLA